MLCRGKAEKVNPWFGASHALRCSVGVVITIVARQKIQ
jgi:hypothetical protein